MIAYFILVHRLPDQFKRMFEAIYHPANHYLIHVDKNSGPALAADIAAFLAPYQNTEMLAARKAQWGGYSLVDAELRGMTKLLEMDGKWSHFINLSGQDFPLKSQGFIRDYLIKNEGKEYIRILDQAAIRPDTMHRVGHICIEALGRIFRTAIPRKFLKGATPYIGTQWKIVSRSFCEFVCHAPEADRFKRFYKNSFIADESFFQTMMMNGAPHGEIVRDDLRMIDWVPDGVIKLRPRTFGTADAAALLASPDLFARKFDANEDAGILDILERHIRKPHIVAVTKPPSVRLPVLDAVAAVAA
jgi:Core-2/I-Branching enzyme